GDMLAETGRIFGEETVALGGKLKAEVMGMFGGGGGSATTPLGHIDTDIPAFTSEAQFRHSMGGEIKAGKLKGLHHVPSNSNIAHLSVQPNYRSNSLGFYEANVEIVENGIKYTKMRTTMWPDSLSQEKIANEVEYAFKNKVPRNDGGFEGTTNQGIKVRFYDRDGTGYNFFPIIQ
ncbi:MAG: EndoU domain-containing protein, partial [Patescibacteria group bacterium]|nr:EndoU domain-containing protein [Patescibacteria group bacterium]